MEKNNFKKSSLWCIFLYIGIQLISIPVHSQESATTQNSKPFTTQAVQAVKKLALAFAFNSLYNYWRPNIYFWSFAKQTSVEILVDTLGTYGFQYFTKPHETTLQKNPSTPTGAFYKDLATQCSKQLALKVTAYYLLCPFLQNNFSKILIQQFLLTIAFLIPSQIAYFHYNNNLANSY
jgi:hypothetical protein